MSNENTRKKLALHVVDPSLAILQSNMEVVERLEEISAELKREKTLEFKGATQIKGDKGDTPVKGVDYFTEEEQEAMIAAATPVFGVDYFTESQIKEVSRLAKPVLGVDFLTAKDIKEIKEELKPIAGIDFVIPDAPKIDEEKLLKKLSKSLPKPVDENKIVAAVLKEIPKVKPIKFELSQESLLERINKFDREIDWKVLKNVPYDVLNPGKGSGRIGRGGATRFTQLIDAPTSYTGQTLKAVRVNAAETGLEFYTPSSGGVTSVTSPLSSLVFNPTTGAVEGEINLSHANDWTGQQRFNTIAPIFGTMTEGSVLFAGASGLLSQDNNNYYYNNTLDYLGLGTSANPKAPLHGKQNNTYSVQQTSASLQAVATVAPNLAQSAATAVAVSIGNVTPSAPTQNIGSPSYLYTDGSTTDFQFYAYKTINGVKYFSSVNNISFTDPINNGGIDPYTLTFTWSAVGSPDGYFVYDSFTSNTWDLGNNTTATFDGGASYTWDVGSQTYESITQGYSSTGSTRAFTAYSYGNDPSGVSVRYYSPTVQNLTVTEPGAGEYYIVTLNQGTLVSNATGVRFLDGSYGIEGITTNTNVYPLYWSTNNQGMTITPTTYGILSTGQTMRFQQYARATFPNVTGTPFELYASPGQFADVTLPNDGQYRYITFGTWSVATSNMPSDTNTAYGYKIKRTISGVDTYKNTSTFSTFASAPTSFMITANTTFPDSSTISPQTFIPQSGLLESAANTNPVSSPNALTQLTLKSTVTSGLAGLRITDSTDHAKALFYNYAGITNLRVDTNGWKIGSLSGTDWGFFNGSSGNFALGSLNAQAKLNVTSTSELFRFKYDESNYVTGTVSATGNITLNGAGSGTGFTFAKKVDIQSSLQVDSIVNDTGLAHGTYTPTLSNTTNVSASTARLATYMRVGNTVTVSGQLDIDPTTTLSPTVLGVSLPVASNFSTAYQCGGAGNAVTNANHVAIEADATNDRAVFKFTPVDVTNQTFTYTFTYQVL